MLLDLLEVVLLKGTYFYTSNSASIPVPSGRLLPLMVGNEILHWDKTSLGEQQANVYFPTVMHSPSAKKPTRIMPSVCERRRSFRI